MNVERLNKLADFLDRLSPSQLDMSSWFNDQVEGGPPGCGTAACAAGWATRIPEFSEAGFTRSASAGVMYEVGGFTWYAWDAVMSFFGLPHGDAMKIFHEDAYYDPDIPDLPFNLAPQVVAERIRQVVSGQYVPKLFHPVEE